MDIKSNLRKEIETHLDQINTKEKAKEKELRDDVEMSTQVFNDVSKAVRQMSREIARYKSGVSLRMNRKRIIMNYKYGEHGTRFTNIYRNKDFYSYPKCHFIVYGEGGDHLQFGDARSTIDWITGWCAGCIADSATERVQSIKFRAKSLRTVIFVAVVLVLLFMYLSPNPTSLLSGAIRHAETVLRAFR